MHTNPSNIFSAGSLVQANSANGVALFTGYDLKPGEVRTCRVTIANPSATALRARLVEADATSDFDAGSMTLTIQEMGHQNSATVYRGDIGGVRDEGIDLGYFEPGEEPVKVCVSDGIPVEFRKKLPPELVYQLSSDTVTNFFEGTLESGKWTDASILFGGVTNAAEIPEALAQIVNQYIAEHMALHDRPSRELTAIISEALEPWGVGFKKGRAVALPGSPKKLAEIQAQFDIAIARKSKSKKPGK